MYFKKKRMIEARFLRSDGKPNFSDRIHEVEGELRVIANRPVVTVSQRAPIREAVKLMLNNGFRRLPVVMPNRSLVGIVTSTDLVNYFGGGDFFRIVDEKHFGDIYSSMEEPLESIMTRNVIRASVDETMIDVLERMVVNNVGAIPIVDENDRVYGIITERDILRFMADKIVGRKVHEVMTKDVIVTYPEATIRDAAQTMVNLGFRRLPVVEDGFLHGIVVCMDIIRAFDFKNAFKFSPRGSIYDILRVPVSEIMTKRVVTIDPSADLGSVAAVMMRHNIGALPVIEDGELIGIITERDLVYELVLESYR